MINRPELWVAHLGLIPYAEAVDVQERIRAARQARELPDVLLMLEHPPVYSKGRRTEPGELPLGDDFYRERGIEVTETERVGRVTYHGPGQIVGYPIMEVGRVRPYIETMERALVAALRDEGIAAEAPADMIGVWTGGRKIASVGVHVARGVSMHGFAVNVANDLTPFEWIVPCGIDGVRMTSIALETGGRADLSCFRRRAAWRFAQAFERRQRLVSLERLLAVADASDRAPLEPLSA